MRIQALRFDQGATDVPELRDIAAGDLARLRKEERPGPAVYVLVNTDLEGLLEAVGADKVYLGIEDVGVQHRTVLGRTSKTTCLWQEFLKAKGDAAIQSSYKKSGKLRDGVACFLHRTPSERRFFFFVGTSPKIWTALADGLATAEPESSDLKELRRIYVGRSAAVEEVRRLTLEFAPANLPVLIHGPTGTGKGVVAEALHAMGGRRNARLVAINCGAFAPTLIEGELFGHEKGAFTGADSMRRGHFEVAHTGTIFLDEIGDLPRGAQATLLHVLQHKFLYRVGGTMRVDIDVRVISATNRDLRAMVGRGEFREDLYFRLAVLEISTPPLRAYGDIEQQVLRFWRETENATMVSPSLVRLLASREWPGNVRELENVLARLAFRARGREPTREMLVGILSANGGGQVTRAAKRPKAWPAKVGVSDLLKLKRDLARAAESQQEHAPLE